MCNATQNKSFGFVLTVVDKVCEHIVLINGSIIVFLYQLHYFVVCVMLSFWFLPSFDEQITLQFLLDAFHVNIKQRIPILITHTIIYV